MIRYRLFFLETLGSKKEKKWPRPEDIAQLVRFLSTMHEALDQSKHVIRAIMVHTGIPALGRQSRRSANDLRDPYLKNIRLSRIES